MPVVKPVDTPSQVLGGGGGDTEERAGWAPGGDPFYKVLILTVLV